MNGISGYVYTSKNGQVHEELQNKKISLQNKNFGFSRKTVLANVRKLHAKFHRAGLIIKSFKIEGTRSLTKKGEDTISEVILAYTYENCVKT